MDLSFDLSSSPSGEDFLCLEETSHIACDVIKGIGGDATNKQICNCITIALLASLVYFEIVT